jgi:hypothetical protein
MQFSSSLTTADVLAVFAEEIQTRQGQVTDTFHDGQRLFTRSVLPCVEHVRPGDRVQGGVALKATEGEVWLFPYFFRVVCTNGAIMAQTIDSRSVVDLHLREPDEVRRSIRESIGSCCAEEVFTDIVRRMRNACETQADLAISLLPQIARLSPSMNTKLLTDIMERFFREGDESRFGLANAVTALARDTQDPDLRWNLEEFGGGIAIGKGPRQPSARGPAKTARSNRAVAVG